MRVYVSVEHNNYVTVGVTMVIFYLLITCCVIKGSSPGGCPLGKVGAGCHGVSSLYDPSGHVRREGRGGGRGEGRGGGSLV